MNPNEGLLSILYVSAATRLLDDGELEEILKTARAYNVRHGITGVLLYGDGNFMQFLEGPEGPVAELYERIRRDARHHQVITIERESGLPREFADWSMAYRQVDAPTWLRLSHAICEAGSTPERLSGAREVLRMFWRSTR